MSYNEESAAISNLVDDLEAPANAPHCATTNIAGWVTLLKEQNNSFQTLLNDRNSEYANKNSGDVRAARLIIDPVYEKMTSSGEGVIFIDYLLLPFDYAQGDRLRL